MFLQPQLRALLRDGAQGAERHDVRSLQRSWRKFAAFAYVAEQCGYRTHHSERHGAPSTTPPHRKGALCPACAPGAAACGH
ncbi:hypothetical protein [Streptomyces sp. NRRL F-5650]|uniref:hypothetical protein n=1 Tax=Streptomyces sp. NRRL F-5650 TaxID=1463868 RepID=UPI00068B498E|nr:hypothetical protein [Streptomyces sp. NRRL F-5650]